MNLIRFLCFLVALFPAGGLRAQYLIRDIRPLKLPGPLRSGSLEFSGMASYRDEVLLLPENRVDKLKTATEGIYLLPAAELSKAIKDTTYELRQYRKSALEGLEKVQAKLPHYQGLEALAVHRNRFFILIETDTTDSDCYLVSGRVAENRFVVDPSRILPLPKPRKPDGTLVFNAGFESLLYRKGRLYAFFEYNYFDENHVLTVRPALRTVKRSRLRGKIPFRLTDVAGFRHRFALAVNYFYPLEAEKDYHSGLVPSDSLLINQNRRLHPFTRLLLLKSGRKQIRIREQLPLTENYWNTNWEALTSFGSGMLLLNDKFTNPGRGSTLLYLSVVKKKHARQSRR